MQFTFTYNHKVQGFVVAAYDGTAHITGTARNWQVEAITLAGCKWDATKIGGAGVVHQEVKLPYDDTMHPVILDYIETCEDRIEEELIALGRGGYNTDMDEGPMQHERL